MAERAEIILAALDKTAAAFASAKRNITQLQTSANGLVGRFAAVTAGAGAIGATFAALDPRGVIDAADALAKLSQRSGVAVEELSALQYAAKLSDVSTEQLAGGLKKLNQNIAAAARGEQEQAEAFKAIGVSVTDASGKVRSADAVFADIAERFQTYKDGANKVALANALGGRSFAELIPLLNGGRDGIRQARIELEQFGGIIGSDLAAKSERFNDNLTRLAVAADALKVAVAGNLIDGLVAYSQEAVEAAKSSNLLGFALGKLVDVFSGKATRELTFGPALDEVQTAQAEVDKLTATVAQLQKALAQDTGNAGLVRNLAQVERAAQEAGARLAALRANSAGAGINTASLSGAQRALVFDKDRSPVQAKRDAPALAAAGAGSRAAADAEALLRKTLDGRIKAIQEGLEAERDLTQFNETRLSELYQRGSLSISAYFDAKAEAQRDFLAKQQQGFDDEIAALRDVQAKLAKPQDRQEIENKVNEVLQRQAKAYREAGQAAEVAEAQRQRAADEFAASVRALDAQIRELSGDRYGAELLRNAEELDKARQLLAKGGGDAQREQALANALQLQAERNRLQEDNYRIAVRAQQAEEAFMLEAERAGLSRADTEAGINRIREQSISQLDELIARTAELVQVSAGLGQADPDLLAFYENLRLMRERAFEQRDPGLLRFNELAREAGEVLAIGFEDAIVSGRQFNDVIRDIEKSLVALVTRDLITTPLAQSLTQLIKDLGAGGSGGGAQTLLSGLFKSAAGLFGSAGGATAGAGVQGLAAGDLLSLFFHGGGVVGAGGTLRMAPAVPLATLPRYHGGGIAGLQPDEVHAVLRKGEEVLTQADPRHRDNGGRNQAAEGAVTVNNTFWLSGPVDQRTQQQIAARTAVSVERAARRGN
jgi:hypothetical protein